MYKRCAKNVKRKGEATFSYVLIIFWEQSKYDLVKIVRGVVVTKMCVAAANYIIEKTNEYNKDKKYSEQISMTCKRLQKLLYFSEIEYMKKNDGQAMFKDEFHAWPSGPVIPSVYHKFMQYQNGRMSPIEGEHTPLTFEMKEALDHVFYDTVKIDTFELVKFSHISKGPWDMAYKEDDLEHTQIVSKKHMFEFYKKRKIFVF